ncbi:MAG: uracil-DNA glycosylase [Burkholderiales bacterium]
MRTLRALNARIIGCSRCPRLVAHCRAIAEAKRPQYRDWEYWGRPIPGFGDPHARLFVIGLAPAAHGGNRTGRVFTGDRSGDWLYNALHRFEFANQATSVRRDDGLQLRNCYVAAAVRCAPPGNKPETGEFEACRPYLVAELKLLKDLRAVVTLGKIAFDQYLKACRDMGHAVPVPLPRFGHGVTHRMPWGVTLIASYHPSQQNTFTGRLTRRMFYSVFRNARACVDHPT